MKSIPNILNKEDVEGALKLLLPDLPAITKSLNKSRDYDLLWKGFRFPPKVVISKAIEEKTHTPFPPSDFSGGNAAGQANYVLQNLGFNIVAKNPTLPLILHERYSRKDIYGVFGIEYNSQQQHLNLGMSPILPDGGYFIFITLNKDNFDESYDYDDQIFVDTLFTTTRRGRSESHPDYVNLRKPETRVSLFIRNNSGENFLYAGELEYKIHNQFIDPKTGKFQQSYTFAIKDSLTDELLTNLTLGINKTSKRKKSQNQNIDNKKRKPSTFNEFKQAYSYALGESNTRTVIPAHHNYQVKLSNFLIAKGLNPKFEADFIDVQFSFGENHFIGEIKVTTNLSIIQAFRIALGQLLEYANLRFDDSPQMIMFLDQKLDQKRIDLATKLSISIVVKDNEIFKILNPELDPVLTKIFT